MIALIVISVITAMLSGVCKAVCDLSEENKLKFYNKSFWNKSLSWQNKWITVGGKKVERFWGSSRWFVAFTDAWHLFGLLQRITFAVSFTITGYLAGTYGLIWLCVVKANYIIFVGTFHIFHTTKILKK